jgi:hypothetical protein
MHLDDMLVGTTIGMSKELASVSNNRPLFDSHEKSTNCLASTSCLAYGCVSIVFFSTCFSFFKSLIIMIIGAGGEKCLQRPHNVSSSPFPIVATRCKA